MTDLPSQWVTPSVPATAATASPEWITARVETLLAHFFQFDEPTEVYRMRMADWRETLGDLPQDAIELATRARLMSDSRVRPIPGEIRALAKSFILRPAGPPDLRVVDDIPALDPARAAEIAAEVKGAASRMFRTPVPLGPIGVIITATVEVTGIVSADMYTHRRLGVPYRARLAAMYLTRMHTAASYPEMGKAFDRDHTSVMAGVKKAAGLIDTDPTFAEMVAEIEWRLTS